MGIILDFYFQGAGHWVKGYSKVLRLLKVCLLGGLAPELAKACLGHFGLAGPWEREQDFFQKNDTLLRLAFLDKSFGQR